MQEFAMNERGESTSLAPLRRATVSDDETREAVNTFDTLISSHLRRELERFDSDVARVSDIRLGPDIDVRYTNDELRRYRDFWVEQELRRPLMPLTFTLNPGNRLMSPPFDLDWSTGSGLGFLSRYDGDLYTVANDGYSAAGVGVFLDTPTPIAVALTPVGTQGFSWLTVNGFSNTYSSGGLGVLIYQVGNPSPLAMRQVTLWNVSGGRPGWTGDTATGSIADAASPAIGFGPIPLAPLLVDMHPGVTYLFWIWIWQHLRELGSGEFFALQDAHVSLITSSAGPQTIIH
jgi:hypothetical protein